MAKQYFFRLSNGQVFRLKATESLEYWLQQFAEILNLNTTIPHNGALLHHCHTIVFTTSDLKSEELPGCIPENSKLSGISGTGWTFINLHRSIRHWYSDDSRTVILEFNRGKKPPWDEFTSISHMMVGLNCIVNLCGISGCFPLHAALLKKDKGGIAILAPSGTGKSTYAKRARYPWETLSDDLALVVPLEDNRYAIHPLPSWKEIGLNTQLNKYPIENFALLEAIYFLRQGSQDLVTPCPFHEAVSGIYRGIEQISHFYGRRQLSFKEQIMEKKSEFDAAYKLAQFVPSYWLDATYNGQNLQEIDHSLALKIRQKIT